MRRVRTRYILGTLLLATLLVLVACGASVGTGGSSTAPATSTSVPCMAAACVTVSAVSTPGQPVRTPGGGAEPINSPGESFPHPTAPP